MGLGLELAGTNATWTFETGQITIRYGRGLLVHGLLKQLGEITVPDRAIAGATVTRGRKPVLRLQPRSGADPLLTAAAGQLTESADPYRLVLRPGQLDLAEHYADDIRGRVALNPDAERPAERFLMATVPLPVRFSGEDAEVTFDGQRVVIRWTWSAHRLKRQAGDQTYPLAEITGVEWVSDGYATGRLRFQTVGDKPARVEAKHDLAAVILSTGEGLVAGSLPLAAAVLVALQDRGTPPAERSTSPAEPPAVPGASGTVRSSDEVISAIRQLGELRDAGLLTEEEFQAKKGDLLGRL